MGQTPSQPGSPQGSQEPESEPSESRKSKRSKSRKPREDKSIADTATQRDVLEEESARALMQLSSSGSRHDPRAPYYVQEGGLQPSAHVGEQQHPEHIKVKKSLNRKRKRNEKEPRISNRQGKSQMNHDSTWTRPVQGLSASPPTHPLDQEASDNELVQEYEMGLSQSRVAHMGYPCEQPLVNLNHQGEQEETGNPHRPALSPKPSVQEETRARTKDPSKRRKRRAAQTDVQCPQDIGMPLDPELLTTGPMLPSVEPDSINGSGVDRLLGVQPRHHSKRRRVEEPQQTVDREEGAVIACDVDDVQLDFQDQVIPGLEDKLNLISRNFGVPYTEYVGTDGLRHEVQATNEKNKTSNKATSSSKHGFTVEEITKLDDFRDHYCKVNDMPISAFNHFVQSNLRSNEQVGKIFKAIQELFSYRSRSSVQRFCRRRFHNFHARGVWTSEEDANLKAAVASRGTCWKVIGEQLGRFSEDCRDRYRNYLAPSAENRNKDAWTETEVVNLSHSILECMQRIRYERQRQGGQSAGHACPVSDSDSDQEAEDLKLINWQTVSDLMGSYGTARSRIQCSFKWSKIKEADRGRYLKEIKEAKENLRNLESGNYTANNMKQSTGWRLKAASKQVKNMKSGDKYDLLNAISDSGAPREENIPWRIIGDDTFRQRWSFSERKAGWLMMKEQVEGSELMHYRQIIQQLLADLLPHGVSERWSIDIHGLVEGSSTKRSRQVLENNNNMTNGKRHLQTQADQVVSHQAGPTGNEIVRDSREGEGNIEEPPVLQEVGIRPDRRSESPNSLFDAEESPEFEAISDPLLDDPPTQALNAASAEISPELATQIQTHLRQVV